MMLSIQIAKFKFCQYQLRAISPNLMLAKITCFTVCTGSTKLSDTSLYGSSRTLMVEDTSFKSGTEAFSQWSEVEGSSQTGASQSRWEDQFHCNTSQFPW